MGLKITLKPNEKIMIGSAVIKNCSKKCEFEIQNKTIIILEKDMMSLENANSPAKKIYFLIQMMYIEGSYDKNKNIQNEFNSLMNDFNIACPNSVITFIINEIKAAILLENNFYDAMKLTKLLIKYEAELNIS